MKSFLPDLALPQTLTGTDDPKHPFGLAVEVPDPEGDDVKEFAANVKLSGDDDDQNASQWCDKVHQGKRGSLDGLWESRGNADGGRAPAQVKTVGDWDYILVCSDEYYLIKARRKGNRLLGRYISVEDPASDTGPWVGLIVNDERINVSWTNGSSSGRWDLRRDLPPSVALTSPASDDYVAAGEPVLLKADVVTAKDVTVRRVEFLIDGSPVGEVTDPPYQFKWDRAKQGQYSATAKIYDSEGGTEETLPVDVFVGIRVRNRSFEQDEAILNDPAWRAWVAYPYLEGTVEIDATESIDGVRSLRIEPRAGSENFWLWTVPIALEVGQCCTMSFWAKAAAPRPLQAYFCTKNSSGQFVSWGWAKFQLTTEWAKYSTNSVVAIPAALEFEFAATGDINESVTLWLDLVSVDAEARDEPNEPD